MCFIALLTVGLHLMTMKILAPEAFSRWEHCRFELLIPEQSALSALLAVCTSHLLQLDINTSHGSLFVVDCSMLYVCAKTALCVCKDSTL